MTGQVNPLGSSQKNFQGVGVPDENLGIILQRGGEELLLIKVGDRFTVRPSGEGDRKPQQEPTPPSWAQEIPGQWQRRVPNTQLEEFIIDPGNLEKAMQAARALDAVAFVSHVYEVKRNPGLLMYVTDEVTIQFGQKVDAAVGEAIAASVGLHKVRPVAGIPNTFIFEVTGQATENPIKIANRLMRQTEVLTAEPNIVVQTQQHYRPKDTLYSKQWYLYHTGGQELAAGSHIDIEKAWDVTRGIRSVVVAIADDSVDLDHPDFQGPGKIVAPRDLKGQDFLPLPEEESDNHGTSCAGVAVAEETGTGIVGVAPGCALMPIRTTGYLDDEAVEQVFDWAIEKGASVISCSWGASAVYFPLSLRQSAALTRAATKGRNGKGCVIIFAAGNANRPTNGTVNESGWPNNALKGATKWMGGFTVHPDVITVSASTSLGKKSAYSNWGPTISVCAPSNNAPPGMYLQETGFISTPPELNDYLPGVGVFTADRLGPGGYDQSDFTAYFGGTSSACPVVAGVAALVLSVNPELTAAEVKKILQQSADKIIDSDPDPQLGNKMGSYDANGYSQWFGYGKVNAYKAVRTAQRLYAAPLQASRQIKERNNRRSAIPDYKDPQQSFFPLKLMGRGDRQGLTSEIAIADTGSVRDIRITVDIEHSFLGDLEIYLINPNDRTVLLQNRTLGSQTKLQTSYTVQNTPALRQLLNQPAKGTWQLWAIDYVLGDTGILNSWELALGV